MDDEAASTGAAAGSLASVRAAIEVVAGGAASRVTVRVTVHALAAEQILPAARVMADAAGVALEPNWWTDDPGCDIVISAAQVSRPRAGQWAHRHHATGCG